MRLGFVTCVQLGLSCMEALYKAGGALQLVITLRDDLAVAKSGRVYLDSFCSANKVPLVKIRHINDMDCLEAIQGANLDYLFVIGWSQIANDAVLFAPRQGCLGMHPTLLPEGRGRAAVPWAILKGLPETGVTLFRLASQVDDGPILEQRRIPLPPNADATWLYEQVNVAHAELMQHAFAQIQQGALRELPQDVSRISHWPARKPEDGRIDLAGSVYDAERLIRAVTRPYPGAFVEAENGKLIVWRARVQSGPTLSRVLEFYDGKLECLDWELVT